MIVQFTIALFLGSVISTCIILQINQQNEGDAEEVDHKPEVQILYLAPTHT